MCIFCEIIEGNIPSAKVYEDDEVLAILDVSQLTKGHTLVMPKKHVENLLECDDETLQHLILVTKKLAKELCDKLGAEGCNIINNTNPVAGQSVMHLHFHIIPRYGEDDAVSTAFEPNHEPYDLNEILKEINA